MPNLVGIFDPAASASTLTPILDRQLSRIRNAADAHVEHRMAQDGFAAGLLEHKVMHTGAQPARSDDERYTAFLDGELFNLGELCVRHALKNAAGQSAASICLELYMRHGPQVFNEVNGFFVLAIYCQTTAELTLISDRFGFRPLFYSFSNGRVVFGTELKGACAAASSSPTIDRSALVELFSFGSHIAESTWLNGFKRIAPATVLTCNAKGVTSLQYWNYRYDENVRSLDQTTYTVNFAKLLDRAVERQMSRGGRIGIFLSGGYDSRAIAGSIRRYHLPIPAFTFGVPGSRDARIAPMLATRLGFQHRLLGNQPGYLRRNCHAIAWRTEGMLPFHRTTSIQHHAIFAEQADVFLLGFLGELSGSHTWPALLLARSRKATIDTVFNKLSAARSQTVRRIFRGDFLTHELPTIRDRFEAGFTDIDNDHPLNLADAWRLRVLHPRTSYQATAADRGRFEIRAPHIDPELVDFQLQIPPSARIEQRIYKKMIATSFPNLRDIPCANDERPIEPNFFRAYARMTAAYAGRTVTKVARRLLRHPAPMGREITDYSVEFRQESALISEVLQPLLEAGIFDSSIFDIDSIRTLINEHYARGRQHEEVLGSLIAWGLAAQYILHGQDLPVSERP